MVAITKAVDGKVASLTTPARASDGGRWWTSKWKVPKWMSDTSEPSRPEGQERWWVLGCKGKPTDKYRTPSLGYTQASLNIGAASDGGVVINGKRYNRFAFYPLTDLKLDYITCKVRGYNSKGAGPWAEATRTFSTPQRPTMTDLKRTEGGGVYCDIDTPSGVNAERYDTRYQIRAWDSRKNAYVVDRDTSSLSEHLEDVGTDISDQQALGVDDYIRITVRACARGFAGDSSWVERSHVIAWPMVPVIKSVSCSSTEPTGICTANITFAGDSATHPVDGVKLEVLKSSTASTVTEATASLQWVETGAVDNGNSRALAVGISDIMPDAGKYSWVRVKSWHDEESTFYRYSAPIRVTDLETPAATAADDAVKILSIIPAQDGTSAIVHVAWDVDGTDDSTGTEVSWATDPNAWRSTAQPETYSVTWDDGPVTEGSTTYHGSCTLYVMGLSEGASYYVRARRYLTNEGVTTYGPYSDTELVIPVSSPTSVQLTLVTPYYEGKSARFEWAYDSSATQQLWQLRKMAGTEPSESDTIIASGTDSAGWASVSWERVEPLLTSGTMSVYVVMSTGGEAVRSNVVSVTPAKPIEVLASDATVTRQPLTSLVTADAEISSVAVVLRANGATGDRPSGTVTQHEGDVIWSGVLNPEWSDAPSPDSPMMTYSLHPFFEEDPRDQISWEFDYDEQALARIYYDKMAGGWFGFVGHFLAGDQQGTTATVTLKPTPIAGLVSGRTYYVYVEKILYDGDAQYSRRIVTLSFDSDSQFSGDTMYINRDGIGDVVGPVIPLECANPDGTSAFTLQVTFVRGSGEQSGPVPRIYLRMGLYASETDEYIPMHEVRYGTITLPAGLDLWDGAAYTMSVSSTDENAMAPMEVGVTVDYEHKAPAVGTVSIEHAEADGYAGESITASAPDGAESTDVADIYRVTPDGYYLIAAGIPFGSVVRDPYPPYGTDNLRYRVAVRTIDGDVEWADFPYDFENSGFDQPPLRIDFGPQHIDLTHNVTVADAYAKTFEARTHVDGTTNGYWDEGVSRTGQLATALIREYEDDQLDLVRALARHVGPCFVRTTDGIAYQADVQINGINAGRGPSAMPVTIAATEVELTAEYMAVQEETDGD